MQREQQQYAESDKEKTQQKQSVRLGSFTLFIFAATILCAWGYLRAAMITCAAYIIWTIIKITGADFSRDKSKARRNLEKLERREKMEQRTKRCNIPGSVWNAVFNAAEAELCQVIEGKPRILDQRAEFGETPLLLLFLFNRPGTNHLAIAKRLLREYPHLVMQQYQATDKFDEDSEYHGENCLHIAIAKNRDYELVKFILAVAKDSLGKDSLNDLLNARADGRFFRYGQTCYFGETPLNFAVAANRKDIVRMLVEHGADLDAVDSNGNTCLHIAVHHGRIEMWDELVCLWHEKHGCKDVAHHIGRRKNIDGSTPLIYAARTGQIKMFEHILDRMKTVQWKWGPVTNLLLPLIGGCYGDIDYIAGPGAGAVEFIIREGSLDLLMLPIIQDLIDRKWEVFAYRFFHERFTWALGNVFSLTLMIVLDVPGMPASTSKIEQCMNTAVHFGCKLFLLYYASGKLRRELQEVWQETGKDLANLRTGLKTHFNQGGSMFYENFMSLCYCCSFCLWQMLDATFAQGAPSWLVALTSFLGWSYLLWFMLGFSNTGHLVVMIERIICQDMVRFASIMTVPLFSFALVTLVCQAGPGQRNIDNFIVYLMQGFSIMTNGFEPDIKAPPSQLVLNLFFSILVSVLLLNMLIAMMGDTYTKVCEKADEQWRLERARIVMSIEQEMTTEERDEHAYWIELASRPGEKLFQIEITDESWGTNSED